VVYTHSTPLTDHLVGLKLKSLFKNIKWVAHFSDPWTLNPYIRYAFNLQKKINKKLETKVLKGAITISVTSNKTKELFIKNYYFIKDKITILGHIFDKKLYHNHNTKNQQLIITHTGNIYGLRSIKPLLYALQEAKVDGIEFRFYGKIKPEEKELANRLGLKSIKFFNQIGYIDSLKAICEADILLVVDAFVDNSPFFPSKLADYIGVRKPIFAITPKNSATIDILKEINNDSLIATSQEEIKTILTKIKEVKPKNFINIDSFSKDGFFSKINRVFFNSGLKYA
jgi:hypothetical protein